MSAPSLSCNPRTEQHLDTVDDTNMIADDGADSGASSPRAATDWNSSAHGVLELTTASSIGYRSGTALDAVLSKSRRESVNASEKMRGDIQADNVPDDSREIHESMSRWMNTPTSPKRPPLGQSESSFANSTKASRGWQTERSQISPSANPPWKPAGSPSVSRPGSAHHITGRVSLSQANSRIGEWLSRSESLDSRRSEPVRGSSLCPEYRLPEDETMSETGEYSDWDHVASTFGRNSADLPSEFEDTPRIVHFANMDMQYFYGDPGEPEYDDLVKENQYLHHELELADEDRGRCHAELHDLNSDVNHLCNAWSKACAAAEVSFDAVTNFDFLVTGPEVDPDSKAAAHVELKANELCRWINDLRDSAENSGLDKVIATYRAELALSSGDLTDNTGTEHDSVNWQTLYEQGRQRLEALKKQYTSSKPEAECVCQSDLECKHRECQAELFDVQDRVAGLEAADQAGQRAGSLMEE